MVIKICKHYESKSNDSNSIYESHLNFQVMQQMSLILQHNIVLINIKKHLIQIIYISTFNYQCQT
jgi:hypothetical protein